MAKSSIETSDLVSVLVSGSKMIWYALHHSNSPLSYLDYNDSKGKKDNNDNKDSNGKINPNAIAFTMWEHFCTVTAHFLGELDSTEEKKKVIERTSSSLASLTSMLSLYFHLTNLKSESLIFRDKSLEILKNFPVEKAELALMELTEKVFISQSLTEKLRKLLMPHYSFTSKPKILETDIEENVLQSTNEMLRNKKFYEAEQSYKSISESSDSKEMRGRAANNLCHLLYQRNRLEEALKYAQIKVENAPMDFKGYFWMSLIYSRMIFIEPHLQLDDLSSFSQAHALISGTFKEIAIYLNNQTGKNGKTEKNQKASFFSTIHFNGPPGDVVMLSNEANLQQALATGRCLIILLQEGEYELQNLPIIGSSIIGLGNVHLNVVSENVTGVSRSILFANLSIRLEKTQISVQNLLSKIPVVFLNSKISGFVDTSSVKTIRETSIQNQAKRLQELPDDKQFEKDQLMHAFDMSSFLQGYGPPVMVCAGKLFLIRCNIWSPLAGGPLSSTNPFSLPSHPKPILYLLECDISHCSSNGLEAREGGSVVCIRSKIHHNKTGPIFWFKAFRADMIGCDIFENENEGVIIQTGDETYQNDIEVRMIDNAVHGNGYIGISTGCMKSLLLKGNEIFDNKCMGVFIQRPRQVTNTNCQSRKIFNILFVP